MKKLLIIFMVFVLTMGLTACQNTGQPSGSESESVAIDSTHTEGTEDVTTMKMSVTIGNQIVMFYGSNSWSYTKIGTIDDLSGWEEALGNGSVTAVFSLAE